MFWTCKTEKPKLAASHKTDCKSNANLWIDCPISSCYTMLMIVCVWICHLFCVVNSILHLSVYRVWKTNVVSSKLIFLNLYRVVLKNFNIHLLVFEYTIKQYGNKSVYLNISIGLVNQAIQKCHNSEFDTAANTNKCILKFFKKTQY